ncbi:sigma-54-dependent transcriptional regulator [Yoonia sp.]|uniref:sigma-54-dependent transcriptional regulator n=1 Tax=Yoonia sp. TaxID=2212373 RepID=UPI003918ED48
MLEGRHIALIEDDEIMGASLLQRLELEGARVVWHKTLHRALGALRTPRIPFDAVLCDIRLPDGSGEDLFLRLCDHGHPPPFVFMTGAGATDQAVRLLRSGAADYVLKPFEITDIISRLVQVTAPLPDAGTGAWFGVSQACKALDADLVRVAARDEPVLLLGEAGTGKRAVAQRLHRLSDRCAAPFVTCDLTRDSANVLHDTLFTPQTGLFARAGEGVILLEQITAASDALQSALLARMWSGNGGPRLVVTAGPDFSPGDLRPDLYFHLSVLPVTIPPLRARPDDVSWLLARLFDGMNARRAHPLRGVSAQADTAARVYGWPGNGRELRSRLMRAMAVAEGDMLFPTDLFPEGVGDARSPNDGSFVPLAETRDAAERAQIERALAHCNGSLTAAAKLLQVGRSTLWDKMQKLGIDPQS